MNRRPCAREAARDRVLAKEIELQEREAASSRIGMARGLRVPYDGTWAWLKMRTCPTRLVVATGGDGGCRVGLWRL